jgi:hypothetical protein
MYKKVFNKIDNSLANIRRDSDSAFIPIDERNADYQQYMIWESEGNSAEEWTGE